MGDGGQRNGAARSAATAHRRADTRALVLIAALASVSLVVEISSRLTEIANLRLPITAAEVVLLELSSHLIIIGLALLLPYLLNRAPLNAQDWRTSSVLLIAGYFCFASLHLLLMYGVRLALFPLVVGGPYQLEMLRPDVVRYEFAKDILTYPALLIVIWLSRALELSRADHEAALRAARADHTLTLKAGGGVVVVNAADILWAKAAGNYAEVHMRAKMHFCRVTLTQLEALLNAANASHARVHKSYLVNLSEIAGIAATGEGDAEITLSNGAIVPASRRYRDKLPRA